MKASRKPLKEFIIEAELDSFECRVTAKNKREARIKVVKMLKRKSAFSLVRTEFMTRRKLIDIDEI